MSKHDRQRSLVANAGDEGQVKKAAELEEFARARMLDGWRYFMGTPIGRERCAGILGACSIFEPIMDTSPYVFEKAGRQAVGLQYRSEMIEADADLFFLMEKEMVERNRRLMNPKPSRTEEGEPDDA